MSNDSIWLTSTTSTIYRGQDNTPFSLSPVRRVKANKWHWIIDIPTMGIMAECCTDDDGTGLWYRRLTMRGTSDYEQIFDSEKFDMNAPTSEKRREQAISVSSLLL